MRIEKQVDKTEGEIYRREYLPVRVNFEAKMKKPSFELSLIDWRAGILPLNYSRSFLCLKSTIHRVEKQVSRALWYI